MYKVTNKFKDKDGVIYEAGDDYEKDLSELRLQALSTNKNRYNKIFLKRKTTKKSYPFHSGGGWYELSDGNKIQGSSEAMEAESNLRKNKKKSKD